MHILFATSECVPFFKKGGLGDVSHGLPVALSQIGIKVLVTLPFYEEAKVSKVCRCLGQFTVCFKKKDEHVFIFQTVIPGSDVPVILFRHPLLGTYEAKAFPFYSLCVSQFYLHAQSILGYSFDILHCNDWHTGLIPILLGEERKTVKQLHESIESRSLKSIYTIHNLLYDGRISVSELTDIGLSTDIIKDFSVRQKDHTIRLLLELLRRVDIISTVSPTYAKEIETSELWNNMHEILRRRHSSVVGILNGIDETQWDPGKDEKISRRYDRKTVGTAKVWNKRKLQREVELEATDDILFAFIGRIEPLQKGIDLILEAVEQLPRTGFQLVVLGEGDRKTVQKLERVAKTYSHVSFIEGFDDRLARRIYAGADVILIPSKFEPCGLNQMIAMRYGTIPLVRKTGGLADTVKDGQTGFVFEEYEPEELCRTIWKAVILRQDDPKMWKMMVERIMQQDFSWEKSAREYVKMYQKLLG